MASDEDPVERPLADDPPVADEPVVAAPADATVAKTKRPGSLVRVLSWIVLGAGVVLILAGGVTWFVVRDQLSQEEITVSADADHFGGDKVNGPLTAYAQANVIRKHALEAADGKTYAELDQKDPARDTVMTASFLRASLFTSVVSFGVAAFAAGMGILMVVIGYVLLRLSALFDQQPAVATT